MAFTLRNFRPNVAGGTGRNWHSYNEAAAMAAIVASGYFNDVAGIIKTGDVLHIESSGGDGLFKATVTSGVVTLAPLGALTGSATWDAGSIADGDEVVTEITVTGAALGDFVLVSHGVDVADLVLSGAVTAANTVTASLANNTGGAIDLASATVRAVVIKQAYFGF